MDARGEMKVSYKHTIVNSERVEEFKNLGWKVLKHFKFSYPQDEGGYEKWIEETNYTIIWTNSNKPIYPNK